MKIELAKTEIIHFIGIGGIGMSGLSLIMKGKGFKVQGSDLSSNKNVERLKIFKEAKLLEKLGVFSIVLECVETSLAKLVSKSLNIPTIGIGASNNCDGQILVIDDLIGLNPISVRFVKKYSNIAKEISKAVSNYSKEVRTKKFPQKKHSY